jgi:hypothetical protein
MIDFDAATTFIWLNARLLDRHRFAHHFLGHDPEPVLRSVRAYQNPDGGFGHALDPDLRGPASGPIATQYAMEIVEEVGARTDPMIGRAADFLASIARHDGGLPFMLRSAEDYPHAEYFTYEDESSLIQTAANAAALHALGVTHPWLERATDWMWRAIDGLQASTDAGSAYGVRFALAFVDALPDGDRAADGLERLEPAVRTVVIEDPAQAEESRTPLDLSPWQGSRSRGLFEQDLIDRHLDALEAEQQPDGGWDYGWPHWNPAGVHEWRGAITVHALRVLRSNGRL